MRGALSDQGATGDGAIRGAGGYWRFRKWGPSELKKPTMGQAWGADYIDLPD